MNALRILIAFAVAAAAQQILTNDSVVKMVKAGLGESLIVSMIQSQPGKYSLTPDELVKLKQEGVPEKILAAMVSKRGAGSSSASSVSSGNTVPNGGDLAQSAQPAQEPEYADAFSFLDSGVLKPLERQTMALSSHVKPLILSHVKVDYVIRGSASPVRFTMAQIPDFIVRLDTGGRDPSNLVWLFLLTAKKDHREFQLAGSRGFSSFETDIRGLPVNVTKYGAHSYKASPTEPLAPGEYMLTTTPGTLGYCFGVDPSR